MAEPAPKLVPIEPPKVKIGGKTIDTATVLPLPSGVWRNRLKKAGLDISRLVKIIQADKLEQDHVHHLALAVLQRADPDITQDMIDEELSWKLVQQVAMAAIQAEGDVGTVDRPTSSDYSTSPTDGDGDLQTSPS